MTRKRIGIIGCGNMGEAVLKGLLRARRMTLMACESDDLKRGAIKKRYKILVTDNNASVVSFSDIIILAVKPKDFDALLKGLAGCLTRDKLVISIAAGITTKYIETVVGKKIPVIRVMPNLPAVVGRAVSGLCGGRFACPQDLKAAKEIFSSIGETIEIPEDLFDCVTAISGSGPAYFFYLIESLIEAGREVGLDEQIARRLVLNTALGSCALLEATKEDPKALRLRVTSKGGTTEAALKVFESEGFKKIVKDAVISACRRSKELSRGR